MTGNIGLYIALTLPIALLVFWAGIEYHKLILKNGLKDDSVEAALRHTNELDKILLSMLVPTGAKIAGIFCVKNEEHLLYGEPLFKYLRTNEKSIDPEQFREAKLYEQLNALSSEMRGLTALMIELNHVTLMPSNNYEGLPVWKGKLEERGCQSAAYFAVKDRIAGEEKLIAILYLKFEEEKPLDSDYIRAFEYGKIKEIENLISKRTKTLFPKLLNYS